MYMMQRKSCLLYVLTLEILQTINKDKNLHIKIYMIELVQELNLRVIKMNKRRWYDKDPILREALELLKISCEEAKDPEVENSAEEFMRQLQEQVAAEVIDRVYEIITEYNNVGSRWYDDDPIVVKAVELLKVAPKKTQRRAALKLLLALEEQGYDSSDTEQEENV